MRQLTDLLGYPYSVVVLAATALSSITVYVVLHLTSAQARRLRLPLAGIWAAAIIVVTLLRWHDARPAPKAGGTLRVLVGVQRETRPALAVCDAAAARVQSLLRNIYPELTVDVRVTDPLATPASVQAMMRKENADAFLWVSAASPTDAQLTVYPGLYTRDSSARADMASLTPRGWGEGSGGSFEGVIEQISVDVVHELRPLVTAREEPAPPSPSGSDLEVTMTAEQWAERAGKFRQVTEVSPGDVLRYAIWFRNTTDKPLSRVAVVQQWPPAVDYLEGTLSLNGIPVPDRGGVAQIDRSRRTITFTVGEARPGERGVASSSFHVPVGP